MGAPPAAHRAACRPRKSSPHKQPTKAARKGLGGAGRRGQGEGAPLRNAPPKGLAKYSGLWNIASYVWLAPWGSASRSHPPQKQPAKAARNCPPIW